MGNASFQIRIMEIDEEPRITANDIESLVGPHVNKIQKSLADTTVDIRAGTARDADHPPSHWSYFIAVRFPAAGPDAKLGESVSRELMEECQRIQIPGKHLSVIQIGQQHQQYQRLVGDFGWQK